MQRCYLLTEFPSELCIRKGISGKIIGRRIAIIGNDKYIPVRMYVFFSAGLRSIEIYTTAPIAEHYVCNAG